MNVYRNGALYLIETEIRAMKTCREQPDSAANDFIFARNQAQASILLGLVESREDIRPDSRSDNLDNMIIRLAVLKEFFNV